MLTLFSIPVRSRELADELTNVVVQYQLEDFIRINVKRQSDDKFHIIIGVGKHNRDMPDAKRKKAKALLGSYGLHLPDWQSDGRATWRSRRVKFRLPIRIAPSDPLSYEHEPRTPRAQYRDTTDQHNRLLLWLSAHGHGTWQQFKAACDTLGLAPTYIYSGHILRRLRLLGHMDISGNGQQWFIAPASLVATGPEDGRYHTFLAGQRSPALLGALCDAADVEKETQRDGNAPEKVRVIFASRADALGFAEDFSQHQYPLYLAGQAALEIAVALPDLTGWENNLSSQSIVRGNYRFEEWRNGDFHSVQLPRATGMYSLTHITEGHEFPSLTLFYDADQNIWRRADWYGLRYLTLRRRSINVEFHYDLTLMKLSIDRNQLPPHMYERSLVLSSGSLPEIQNGRSEYRDVPAKLSRILAEKLEAEPIDYRGH